MPWATSRSRLREKLSKAGPAKGRTSSADSVNELTTTPTIEAVAPSESANTGSVALAMNAAIDWKKFTAIRMTKGTLQIESRTFASASPIFPSAIASSRRSAIASSRVLVIAPSRPRTVVDTPTP